MELRSVSVLSRGKSTVATRVGATVAAIVSGWSSFGSPTIVLLEPDDSPTEHRTFVVLASSLGMPPGTKYVGSARTGEYEVSHVYEVEA